MMGEAGEDRRGRLVTHKADQSQCAQYSHSTVTPFYSSTARIHLTKTENSENVGSLSNAQRAWAV